MQHEDQHIEAIRKTISSKNEVSAAIFDDKVKQMGFIIVSGGQIKITLDYLPSMISEEVRRDFVIDAIALTLKACFNERAGAFDPHRP